MHPAVFFLPPIVDCLADALFAIDTDGCPVVDLTVKIASEHKIDCIILCDISHVFEKTGVRSITVSKGTGSLDFALVNMVLAGNYGLFKLQTRIKGAYTRRKK